MNPKFRAWYVLAEEMIDEILVISFVRKEIVGKFRDGSTSVPLKFEDKRNGEDVILMQSTGLKDKSDTEIFEGDVVRFSHLSGHLFDGFINRVTWDEHNAAFKLVPLNMTWSDTYFSNFEKDTLKTLEVIGNIYENPELVEENNEKI